MKKSRSSFIDLNGEILDSNSLKDFEQLKQNALASQKTVIKHEKNENQGYLNTQTALGLKERSGSRIQNFDFDSKYAEPLQFQENIEIIKEKSLLEDSATKEHKVSATLASYSSNFIVPYVKSTSKRLKKID